MMTLEVVVAQMPGLQHQELEHWIAQEWVRPQRLAGQYGFQAVDVARVRLIRELRHEMQVNEEALPIVLSLLDQLYDLRRRVRELGAAVGQAVPENLRRDVADTLVLQPPSAGR